MERGHRRCDTDPGIAMFALQHLIAPQWFHRYVSQFLAPEIAASAQAHESSTMIDLHGAPN